LCNIFHIFGRENTLQIESPLKRTLPPGGLDGAKYMKNSRDFFFFSIGRNRSLKILPEASDSLETEKTDVLV